MPLLNASAAPLSAAPLAGGSSRRREAAKTKEAQEAQAVTAIQAAAAAAMAARANKSAGIGRYAHTSGLSFRKIGVSRGRRRGRRGGRRGRRGREGVGGASEPRCKLAVEIGSGAAVSAYGVASQLFSSASQWAQTGVETMPTPYPTPPPLPIPTPYPFHLTVDISAFDHP